MFCTDIPAPLFFIFSSSTPHLLYYSHIPASFIALALGLFVYFKNRSARVGSLLLIISGLFFFWSFLDLILWTNIDSRMIAFVWSIVNLIEVLVSLTTLYFSYVFLEKKDVAFKIKIFFGLLVLGFVFLVPTSVNVPYFDLTNCEAHQGPLIYYFYALEIFFFICLLFYLGTKVMVSKKEEKRITVLFALGVFFFLASFSGANIIGSFTEHWEILQYGLFGMPVFMAFLTYLIVRYKIFNIKLFGAQALMFGMVILIGSQFLFIQNPINRILNGVTFVLVSVFGYLLVLSVKKEIHQREEIATMADSLETANLQLKELDQQKTEFLSIASHQLRTPLSVCKGYLELIKDGAYGKPSSELYKVLDNLEISNERLIKLVDEFLNISRIEQGRVKYTFSPFDISQITDGVVEELKERAQEKGLVLIYKNPGPIIINIDEDKIRHVIYNFVDNAIKYTPRGNVKIFVEKDKTGIIIRVKDNGLGFGRQDQVNFFQKFFRGANTSGTNIEGTGLGLYVCRRFIEKHEGRVWAESAGLKKGSEFGFWLPKNLKATEIKAQI